MSNRQNLAISDQVGLKAYWP